MPIRMRVGTDIVSGAEKERFDVLFEEWFAATEAYGGTREEYDRIWAHYHPEEVTSIWLIEHEIDGRWQPLHWWPVVETREGAELEMRERAEEVFEEPLRVREYVPRQEESSCNPHGS